MTISWLRRYQTQAKYRHPTDELNTYRTDEEVSLTEMIRGVICYDCLLTTVPVLCYCDCVHHPVITLSTTVHGAYYARLHICIPSLMDQTKKHCDRLVIVVTTERGETCDASVMASSPGLTLARLARVDGVSALEIGCSTNYTNLIDNLRRIILAHIIMFSYAYKHIIRNTFVKT